MPGLFPVVTHLDYCSRLDGNACHLSHGPLLLTALESPYHFSHGPLLQPGCKSLSSFSQNTTLIWMGVPVISYLYHAPTRMSIHFISHMDQCFLFNGSLCHLSLGPMLPAGWDSLSCVMSYLVDCSSLETSPCHPSHGPLLSAKCEAMLYLIWTLLMPGCESF